ncbi:MULTISPECIES: hypothetical protein [Streptomyces]|uniref:hypothetical protein n=1 Tax=Streptomyces TaxID=1883 RepID=UPI0022534B9A|nr:hypothetical protein [Streptomyces sp. NBC_00892]MCX4902361.1 hypothetical protein [Streptomyces sp. NBC_00892]
MTGARALLLAGAVFSGLLATALLCGEGRAVLAFLRAAWETAAIGVVLGVLTLLGAAIAFGTGPLLGGLDSLMASVVAVVLP